MKILIFFPHNLFPPKTGAHKRCLEVISGLSELGCEISLASSSLCSETEWTQLSIEQIKSQGHVKEIYIYEPKKIDYRYIHYLNQYYKITKRKPLINSSLSSPIGMILWFDNIIQKIMPDSIMMNYAYWDKLINHRKYKSTSRIIDLLDLVTLNGNMQQTLKKYFEPGTSINSAKINDDILQEDFFEKLNLTVSPDEFQVFDQYNHTISISAKEKKLIESRTSNTKVTYLPVTQPPRYISNQYSGNVLLPIGPNPFNLQGYCYFAKRVLPIVRQHIPEFTLQVTGSFYGGINILPEDNVIVSGFVPDFQPVLEQARFMICPIFGGTGQQIKVVESMSNGLAVVALRFAAERSPIIHGVNGFIADNAEQFAEYVIQLWNSPELCRSMGNAARETIANDFSRNRLLEGLNSILEK